ncbi:hypothetical protein [Ferrimonas marina]|uniref:Uncharacterized protein n=1 Tax=Ferrimonas marina TaxID=299255 RepID=A0A1M5MGF3_9GAMM|nr:hypothetical protein [Ferrimonas marina]SHG75979.1 hypothetical protein SAMN02745129_0627 [Ferrimonas marina]
MQSSTLNLAESEQDRLAQLGAFHEAARLLSSLPTLGTIWPPDADGIIQLCSANLELAIQARWNDDLAQPEFTIVQHHQGNPMTKPEQLVGHPALVAYLKSRLLRSQQRNQFQLSLVVGAITGLLALALISVD